MIPVIRHCPDCGWDRLVEQHHAAGCCPDVPGGECPEWSCTECGAALLTGFPPSPREAAVTWPIRERVA